MKKSAYILILITLFTSCKSWEKVYCTAPDQDPVFIFNRPAKAYKVFARDFDLNLKASFKLLDKITIDADDAGYKSDIVMLRDKLSEDKAIIQDVLIAVATNSQTQACNEEISNKYADLLSDIQVKTNEIQRLKLELESIANGGNKSGNAIKVISENYKTLSEEEFKSF
jgi:hypothetical protein